MERNRSFHLVLYADDETHLKAYKIIQEKYSYASIWHDRDILEDGTIKKLHLHVVLHLSSPKSVTALANDLGITSNYIEICKKDYKQSLLYLIHYNQKDKMPYKVEDVEGDLKQVLINYLSSISDENSDVIRIIDLLDSIKENLSLKEFIKILCNNGLYSCFRRSQYTFIQLLKEHNIYIN